MNQQAAGHTLWFESTHRVLMVTLGPLVTKETALEARNAILRLVAAEGEFDGIADFSAIERANITAGDVRSLANMPPAIPPGRKRVLVAPRPWIYGMSRMFQILQEDPRTEVVCTLQEAFDLLGIESPQFKRVDEQMLGERRRFSDRAR